MYNLYLPISVITYTYLTQDIIEKVDKQLLKNISDDDWIKNVFRPDTLNYNINYNVIEIFDDELICKVEIPKQLTDNLYIVADEIIKYICAKQYISLLKFTNC